MNIGNESSLPVFIWDVLKFILMELCKTTIGQIFILLVIGITLSAPTIYSAIKTYLAGKEADNNTGYLKDRIDSKERDIKKAQSALLDLIKEKDKEIAMLHKEIYTRDEAWKTEYKNLVGQSFDISHKLADNMEELNIINKKFLSNTCYNNTNVKKGDDANATKD